MRPETHPHNDPFVLTGGQVISLELADHQQAADVYVKSGRITMLKPHGTEICAGYREIAAHGLTICPGLVDMHVHLGLAQVEQGGEPIFAAAAAQELEHYLRMGVTRIRNMAGSPFHAVLREQIEAGEIPGPHLHSTSAILDGAEPVWPFGRPVVTAEHAEREVENAVKSGFEAIKVYNLLSADAYEYLRAAAARRGLPLVGHVPFDVGLKGCLAAGQRSIEHFRGYELWRGESARSQSWIDRARNWTRFSKDDFSRYVDATIEAGVWNCPTFTVVGSAIDLSSGNKSKALDRLAHLPTDLRLLMENAVRGFPVDQQIADMLRRSLDIQKEFALTLYRNGGHLLIGTDAAIADIVPGLSLHDELAHFSDAGFSSEDILRIATGAPAEFYGAEDWGRIAPGQLADLVVLKGDPLQSISACKDVHGVVVAGRWVVGP